MFLSYVSARQTLGIIFGATNYFWDMHTSFRIVVFGDVLFLHTCFLCVYKRMLTIITAFFFIESEIFIELVSASATVSEIKVAYA